MFYSPFDLVSNTGGVLTFFEPRSYKMATEFMLAHPYGFTRVMSSYHWNRDFHGGEDHNNWQGPPHNGDMSIKGPSIQSDMSCSNGWVRIGTKQIEQGQIIQIQI